MLPAGQSALKGLFKNLGLSALRLMTLPLEHLRHSQTLYLRKIRRLRECFSNSKAGKAASTDKVLSYLNTAMKAFAYELSIARNPANPVLQAFDRLHS